LGWLGERPLQRNCVEVFTGPEILVGDTKHREGGYLAASTAT
jgi:hypothetical protein